MAFLPINAAESSWRDSAVGDMRTEVLDNGVTVVGTIEFNDKSGILKKVKARFTNY